MALKKHDDQTVEEAAAIITRSIMEAIEPMIMLRARQWAETIRNKLNGEAK